MKTAIFAILFLTLLSTAIHAEDDIEKYSKAISEHPKDAAVYFLRGYSYWKNNKTREAKDDFSTAISLRPEVALFYSARGVLNYEKKDYKMAVDDFTKAITLKPESPAKLESSIFKNHVGTQTADFICGILLGDEATLYDRRAEAYTELEQYRNAIKDFSRSIDLKKEELRNITEQTEKAVKMQGDAPDKGEKAIFQKIVAVSLSRSYQGRARCYLKKGEKQKALTDLEEACSLDEEFCQRRDDLKKDLARGEKWVPLVKAHNLTVFLDKSTIKKTSANTVKAWFRYEYDDVKTYIEERKEEGLSTFEYDLFSHQLVLEEMDCSNETIKILQRTDYTTNGKVITSLAPHDSKPKHIIPDSLGDAMYRTVCKEKKN